MTQQECYEALKAVFAQRTGLATGDNDDLSARLWAVAAQLTDLRADIAWSDRQAFPQTAEGSWLDLHGQMRALTRRAGVRAVGVLRLYLDHPLSDPVRVPEGTVCTDEALRRFVTLEGGVIPAGETWIELPARAEESGLEGNAPPDTVVFLTLPPMGVCGVTNPAAFTGGLDPEDDESFRARILDSYHRLPNGANAAWYEARALEVEGAAAVSVLPRWQGIGTVGVVVAGAGGAADAELLERVRQALEPAREIATDVTVMAPETVSVRVTAKVRPRSGSDSASVLSAVRTALRQYFNGTLLGRPVYRAALGQVIYAVEGVENYKLTYPSADVSIGPAQLPVLGTLSVTEVSG